MQLSALLTGLALVAATATARSTAKGAIGMLARQASPCNTGVYTNTICCEAEPDLGPNACIVTDEQPEGSCTQADETLCCQGPRGPQLVSLPSYLTLSHLCLFASFHHLLLAGR